MPLDAQGQARITLNTVGPVTLVATAHDAARKYRNEVVRTTGLQPHRYQRARLAITSPSADAIVTAPTNILGSVQDQELVEYVLSYAKFGSEQYVEFAWGTQQIENGTLGRLIPRSSERHLCHSTDSSRRRWRFILSSKRSTLLANSNWVTSD